MNDHYAGDLCFQQKLNLSKYAKPGENKIEVIFTIGNRNLLGPHHTADKEISVGPCSFDANDLLQGEASGIIYKIRRFALKRE